MRTNKEPVPWSHSPDISPRALSGENPTPGHSDAEALYKVQKGGGRAAELGGEKIKWLINDLEKQVAIAQKASDERKEATRQAQGKAAKQLFEWIVTAIATAPPSPPRDKSSYEQCKRTQDVALAFGDKHMIGAAHLVACF